MHFGLTKCLAGRRMLDETFLKFVSLNPFPARISDGVPKKSGNPILGSLPLLQLLVLLLLLLHFALLAL